MPDARRAAPADARPGYGTRFLVACYTGLGAAGCAYMFYASTLPVVIADDWGAQVPAWLGAPATVLNLLLAWPWTALPVALQIAGFVHLRRASWRWLDTWTGAVAAGLALEALVISGFGYHYPSPVYVGPGIVSWVSLAESLGFAALGVAMMAILAGSERSAAHPAAGRLPA
jgi:hypothetical protein